MPISRNRYKILQYITLALLVAGLALLAACGTRAETSGGSSPTAAVPTTGGGNGSGGVVTVALTTFKIKVDSNSLKAGQVVFHVANQASEQPHEFVLLQTDLDADHLPLKADGTVDEDQLKKIGEVDQLDPGKSDELKANLPAGHYVAICNIGGHYQAGMRTEFTVGP